MQDERQTDDQKQNTEKTKDDRGLPVVRLFVHGLPFFFRSEDRGVVQQIPPLQEMPDAEKGQGCRDEEYRGGDPLNLIHWKLSGKMDELIVREPQEVIRKRIVLSADLPADYRDQQSVIEQLRYLSESLIEKEIPYRLVFGADSLDIASNDDFNDFIKSKLSMPLSAQYAQGAVLGSDMLIYRIRPSRGVAA